MSLRFSYTLIAPFYDAMVGRASAKIRAQSLEQLPRQGELDILINGIGTGLDMPHLPRHHRYVALDLTRAMIERARRRQGGLRLEMVQGSSLALPFREASFDCAVLHLILAVVPDPPQCLREAARTLKPGGCILILDKFVRPGEPARLRRALNRLSAPVATRLDVVFEDVLAGAPGLRLEADTPVLAKGWFRSIRLVKS